VLGELGRSLRCPPASSRLRRDVEDGCDLCLRPFRRERQVTRALLWRHVELGETPVECLPFGCSRLPVDGGSKQGVSEPDSPDMTFDDLRVSCRVEQLVTPAAERLLDRRLRRIGERGHDAKRIDRGRRQRRDTFGHKLAQR
jgi:hypothetical protein